MRLRKSIIILMLLVVALLPVTDVDNNNQQSFAAQTIVINEVELNPLGTDSGQEKVELYNPFDSPADVGGWTLSSTAVTGAIITIPDGAIIPAKGHMLVDSSTQWLDNEREIIVLCDDTGATVDSATSFSDRNNDPNTWQRSPDGSDKWIFALSTLGNSNVVIVSEPATALPASPPPQLSTGNSNNSNYSANTAGIGTLSKDDRELNRPY